MSVLLSGSPAGAHEGGDGGEARRGRLLAAGQRRLVVVAELVRRVPGVSSVQRRPCRRRKVIILFYKTCDGQAMGTNTQNIAVTVKAHVCFRFHRMRRSTNKKGARQNCKRYTRKTYHSDTLGSEDG